MKGVSQSQSEVTQMYIRLLSELSDKAKSLAQRIGDKGGPLTKSDNAVLRMAVVPLLQEAFEEARANFVLGVPTATIMERLARDIPDIP